MKEALAVVVEDRDWKPSRAPVSGDRYAQRVYGTAYKATVPVAIADLDFAFDGDTVAAADDARAAIARFDAELSQVVGEDSEFAPLSSVLLRTESASSSQIENITAGARTLALAELGLTRAGSNAQQVVANVDAMRRALALADEVTPASILSVHEALMRGQEHAGPGAYRQEQVWIGGADTSPHDAAFVPPHHSRVPDGIADLCAFTRRTDMPLLAQAAVAHAQFETIHPFNDGNGRTGRALVHAMLKRGGATTRTTVPVSAGLLSNTQSYFDALTAYRQGDPNPIVKRFSAASMAAIANGRQLAADLGEVSDTWRAALSARGQRRDSVAWRILPVLLSQPAVTSKVLQHRLNASQPAVDRALQQLRDAGVVTSKNEHGAQRQRDVVWRSDEVLGALDRFGERSRRR